ncbi:UDP-glucose 4-epimerase GalE [Pseudochrobactrum algeriensis]|uniref:UDP-glucose 4-epimerase GalE n=1 Tax=Pseudochrobactrum TaxID=354349 RepID=UPI0003A78423|nr:MULTISPECIES: UDP-glucose 4-epimerase GalE [Pseudochrobactrum]MBX8782924.1 UDP-glucose 4-epimerase GalE [Ochrobactrum sp. GRS2]MBX8811239.1 UDP-glucose 4-epimerase GalE [Ochrobactrum sp. MR34]MDP8249656.1 UDP-glucose 4-epimerase GalE [Pseudochrobactrum saccharolyticum]QVQ38144.1 UDP-glucose 4-epimerase GalE [Pseudochrobactrum algeriensis]QVQ41369.1 UDP-glucose 4-epimerase GalE [Pseudochrobactrum algeriensis]
MTILVTGGAGYIGSHTCVRLLETGHDVVVVDNFDNSHPEVFQRIEQITGRMPKRETGDIRDREFLQKVIQTYQCTSVIHFAGLKAVGESTQKPLYYYDCNMLGTLRLLQAMRSTGVKKLVFSSSATVYGDPQHLPLDENHPLSATNPYGRTKLMIEEMLRDLYNSDPEWSIAILRYFNPVGAHESGLIGEDPKGIPNNLMPIIAQVATGRREKLSIWGNDYPTPDGTGVRDYIHVTDLAEGHLRALAKLDEPKCMAINLGTGEGYSVLDVIKAFEHVSNQQIRYEIAPRRPGDVASCYADPAHAKELLGWSAKKTLREMCADMWNWQSKNPNGYAD